MSQKPTYIELEEQLRTLTRENETLRQDVSFLSKHSGITELENHARTLFDNMGDAIFVKDDQSRVVIANDAFCAMFQLPRKDIIGKTLAEHVSLEERESFLKIDKMVLFSGIENINEEPLSIKGEKTRIISTRKSRFIDSNGKKYLVGVIRDITERKEAEKLLKESETKFRDLNSTKNRLFSILAHDLRSPFNHILGFSELLLETDNNDQESAKEYVKLIRTTAQNTLVLLENLLDWAKSQTDELHLDLENVHISEIINDTIRFEKLIAETKNITLLFLPPEEFEFVTDPNILKTILRNLISNAIKFTRPDGLIEITTTMNNHHLEILISDDGVGMSQTTLDNLFDVSTNISSLGTAKESGVGLGLILCRQLVEKLNGQIEVESKEGEGSRFKITLPNHDS